MARLLELDASVLGELEQQLRRLEADDDVKNCIRAHWAKLVPKLFPPTETPLKPDYVQKRIERYLLEPLSVYIADKPPSEVQQFFDSLKSDEKSSLCNKFFKTGEPTFCCRDCATDATCVMCMECFRNSSHTNHRYKMNMSVGGGMCDCGDAEAFISGHACSLHDAGEQPEKSSQEILAAVDPHIVRRTRLVMETCLQYCIDLLANKSDDSADRDSDVTGGMPVDLMLPEFSSTGSSNVSSDSDALTHVCVLFNDEIHTYDQVINALSRTLFDCTPQQATDFASKVDRDGRAPIAFGTKGECERYKASIERNSRRPFPLRVAVLRTEAYAHQVFALHLLSWLTAKTTETEKIKAVFCRVGLSQAAGHASNMVAVLLNSDRSMWKGARMAYQQLLLQCYLQFSDTKLEFTNIYGQRYPLLTQRFVNDEGHAHSDSCTSMSVQIFTVPSLARYLISMKAMHNILAALDDAIFSAFTLSETGTLMFYKVNDKEKTLLKRWFYILNDVKYLLNTVPAVEHWTPQLVDGFCLASDTLISTVGMLEGMDPSVRQTSSHLEYEPDWEMGFNLAFRINSIFYSFVQWCVSHSAVIEHVVCNAFLQLASILTRNVTILVPAPPLPSLGANGELPPPARPANRDQTKTRQFQMEEIEITQQQQQQQQQPYKVIKFDVAAETASVHCTLSRMAASLVAHYVSVLEQQQAGKILLPQIFEFVVKQLQRRDFENEFKSEMPSHEVGLSRQGLNARLQFMKQLVSDVPSLCRILLEMPLRALVLSAQVTAGMWRRNGFSLVHQLYFYQSNRAREFMIDKDFLALQIAGAVMQPDEFLACLLHKFDLLDWAGCLPTSNAQQSTSSSLSSTAMAQLQTSGLPEVDALQTSLFSAEQALAGFLNVLNTAGADLNANLLPAAAQQLQTLTAATSAVMRHSPSTSRNTSQTRIVAEEFLQILLTVVGERYSVLLGNVTRRDIIEYELIHQLCTQPMPHSEIMRNLPAEDDEDEMELRAEVSTGDDVNMEEEEEGPVTKRGKRKAHQEPRDSIVDSLLEQLATFRQPQSGAKGLFLLKPEHYARYNMFFYHYTRPDMSKAETHMAETVKSQQPRAVGADAAPAENHAGQRMPVFAPPAPPAFKSTFSGLVRLLDCNLMLLLLKSVFEGALMSSSAASSSMSNELRASSDGQSLRASFLVAYALYEERRHLMEAVNGSDAAPNNFFHAVDFCSKARESGLLATMSALSSATGLPNVTEYLKYVLHLFQQVETLRLHPEKAASEVTPDAAVHRTEDDAAAAEEKQKAEDAAAAERQQQVRIRRERVMLHMKQMQSNFATKHLDELRVIEQQQNAGDDNSIAAQAYDVDDADMTDVNAPTVHPVCCGQNRTWQHTAALRATVNEQFTCILCAEEQRIDMSGTASNSARSGGDALVYVSFVERSSVLSHAHQRGTEKMNKMAAGEWQADGIFFRQTQAERTFLLDNTKAVSSAEMHEYCLDRRAGISPHISTCGHVMHMHCWSDYFDSAMAREARRHPRLAASISPAETFDVLKNEYRCPLCSRLSNAVMPVMHPQTVYLLQNGDSFARARQLGATNVSDSRFDDWLRLQLESVFTASPSTARQPYKRAAEAAIEQHRRRLATISGCTTDADRLQLREEIAAAAVANDDIQGNAAHSFIDTRSAPNMLTSNTASFPTNSSEYIAPPAASAASLDSFPVLNPSADISLHRQQIRRRSAASRVENVLQPKSAYLADDRGPNDELSTLDTYGDFLYRGEGVAPPPRLGNDYQRALSLVRTQVWQVVSDRGQLLSPTSPSLTYNDHLKVMIRAIAYSLQSMEVALRFDRKALFGDYSFRQHEALRGLMGCFSWIRFADKTPVSSTLEFATGSGRANHEKLYMSYANELFAPLLLLLREMKNSESVAADDTTDEVVHSTTTNPAVIDEKSSSRNRSNTTLPSSTWKIDEFFPAFARLMERDLLVVLIGMLTMSTAAKQNKCNVLTEVGGVASDSSTPTSPVRNPTRRVSHDSTIASGTVAHHGWHQPLAQLGRSILGSIRHSLQPDQPDVQQVLSSEQVLSSSLSPSLGSAKEYWRSSTTHSSSVPPSPASVVYNLFGPSGSINDHQLLKLCFCLHNLQIMLSMPVDEMTKSEANDAELDTNACEDISVENLETIKIFMQIKVAQGEISQSAADSLIRSDKQRCQKILRKLREALLPFLRCAALVFHFVTLINPPTLLTSKPPTVGGGELALFINTQYESLCRYLDLPSTLYAFQNDSEIMNTLIKRFTAVKEAQQTLGRESSVSSTFGLKRFLFRYPMSLPEFTSLPKDYSEVMCLSATFTCRRDDADENLSPTLCLLCGKLLCSSLYCCTFQLKTGESCGACNYHSLLCGAGTGIFLRIRESMLTMMYGIRKHCLYAAPYVDRYGECDPFLRRGNPLTLSSDRLNHILKQYVHHNIADEVVQLFEQQNGGQLALQQL